ncbi:MAG: class I SAM-dependent methyltransferase [Phycisphaerales bacterium]|nr:class I SAM-dependent methyltransferase [Phycisphaerales bacterium]
MQSGDAPRSAPPWWHEFFDDDYAAFGLANDSPELVERIADFIVKALALSPGQAVFDQCCGIGRLSLPLAARGMHVLGVDRALSYIHRARNRAAQANLQCEFHVADAFEFSAPQPCDAAINWFTSFGYTPDDDRNIQMLHRAVESIKPGGRFIMDYLNIPRMMADFRPSIINRPTGNDLDGLIVLNEQKADYKTGLMHSDWTFLYPDGRRIVRQVATRMYMPHELGRLLETAGFVDIQLFGSTDGEPFDRTSRRCITMARKP